MFFLLRMGFWFSLVLLLLPLGAGSGQSGGQAVGPVDAFLAARDAVGDVAGLCERKPDVCRTGAAAIETVSVRAQESGRIAFDLLDKRFGRDGGTGTADTATVTGSVARASLPPESLALPDLAPIPPTR